MPAVTHLGELRPAPDGMPDPGLVPPTVAASGDPFSELRVIDLVARVERGRPVALADLAARLNAVYLDWLFDERVVADALLQLQANWMADYRNSSGIVVEEGPLGATVTIEDSSRVDPWIARQAQRTAAACREALLEFSRRDRPAVGEVDGTRGRQGGHHLRRQHLPSRKPASVLRLPELAGEHPASAPARRSYLP